MSAVQNQIVCHDAPATRRTDLTVRACSSWAELERFYGGWNSLLRASPDRSIFQTPEWLGAWWQSFGAGRELLALIFADTAENLAGLALFYVEQKRFLGTSMKILRLVGAGSGDSDALDFVTAPGLEKLCASAFLTWLSAQRRWDLCALETLPQNSLVAQHVAALARERGWKLDAESSPNFFIPLPKTWEQYLEGLESGFRPLLTRYPKRLRSRYQVSVERCEREQDLDANLQTLFRLHQMRWTGQGEPGAFAMAERRDFYSRMARSFLERGWLEFWLLKLEGRVVAAQFCFRYGNAVYLLQEGFDPQRTADRVGYALRAHVLQEMIRRGATRYDFLGGDDAYKQKFGACQGSYVTLRFAGPSLRGRLYMAWLNGKRRSKARLKRMLPAPLLAIIRRASRNARQDAQPKEATE